MPDKRTARRSGAGAGAGAGKKRVRKPKSVAEKAGGADDTERPERRQRAEGAQGAQGAQLRVKQVRSGIGHAETYRRTLKALGLRHYQQEIVVSDTPSVRGALRKVSHLVSVSSVEA